MTGLVQSATVYTFGI